MWTRASETKVVEQRINSGRRLLYGFLHVCREFRDLGEFDAQNEEGGGGQAEHVLFLCLVVVRPHRAPLT